MNFNTIIMNPPYNNGLGNSFLEKALHIADTVITVQPVSWLIAKKQKTKITKIVDKCGADIEYINGIKEFDAGILGDCAIQYIDTTANNKIHIYGREFDKCEDVKLWSRDIYLEKFVECLGEVKDSIWDHIKGTSEFDHNYEANPNDKWWCVKISKIRGNVSYTLDVKHTKNFYTLMPNGEKYMKNSIGQYKILKNIPNNSGSTNFLYFKFDTEQEMNNFVSYIQTDFLRTCLMLLKTNSNLHRGEMKMIPWFDFSDPNFSGTPKEIDDYLFEKYNISDDIRKHIEEILPDYYGVRTP